MRHSSPAFDLEINLMPLILFVYCVQGHLKGFDQATNLILEGSHERVYSEEKGMEINELGLYIIRGDTM